MTTGTGVVTTAVVVTVTVAETLEVVTVVVAAVPVVRGAGDTPLTHRGGWREHDGTGPGRPLTELSEKESREQISRRHNSRVAGKKGAMSNQMKLQQRMIVLPEY